LGVERYFPKLKAIAASSTRLKVLRQKDLQRLPYLEYIWMKSNKLEYLEGNLFDSNRNVKEIYFQQNNLKNVGIEIFRALYDLQVANFAENSCINKYAVNSAEVRKLKYIGANCPETYWMEEVKNLRLRLENSCECPEHPYFGAK
jgi:hypothetical protein